MGFSARATSVQAEVLTVVAEAIATAGDHDRAENVARSLKDPDQQAQALTTVAEAIATAGDHDRAGWLMGGGVLAVASWQVSLSLLAGHWPQVILRHVDELSGNERSRYT